jgi:hypothetical protein
MYYIRSKYAAFRLFMPSSLVVLNRNFDARYLTENMINYGSCLSKIGDGHLCYSPIALMLVR